MVGHFLQLPREYGQADFCFVLQKAVTKNVKGASAQQPSASKPNKIFIDFSGPANDGILDASSFEKYLHDHIKVEGKAGQLGDVVKVQKEG